MKRVEGYTEVLRPEAFRRSFAEGFRGNLDPEEIIKAIRAGDIKPVQYPATKPPPHPEQA